MEVIDQYLKVKRKQKGVVLLLKNIVLGTVFVRVKTNMAAAKEYRRFRQAAGFISLKFIIRMSLKIKKHGRLHRKMHNHIRNVATYQALNFRGQCERQAHGIVVDALTKTELSSDFAVCLRALNRKIKLVQ